MEFNLRQKCPLCEGPVDKTREIIQVRSEWAKAEDKLVYVFCLNCGLVFDKYEAKELLRIINESYTYNDFLKRLNKKKKFYDFRKKQLFRYLGDDFRQGMRLLDVGTSDGSFLKVMKDAGFDVLGVEPESRFSEYCRKLFQIEIIPDFLEKAPLQKEYFDIVTVFDVLEHIYRPHKFIQSIFDILKPGGRFYMAIPGVLGVHSYSIAKGHTCLYSKSSLKQLLEAGGFRVLNIEDGGMGNIFNDHIEVFAIKDNVLPNYKYRLNDKFPDIRCYLKWSVFRGHFEWHYFKICDFINNRINRLAGERT